MLPSSCTCVLLLKLWTLSCVTWRIFHSGTFPQFIPSPFFVIQYTKLLSGFAIRHPGQSRVPLLVCITVWFNPLHSFFESWNVIFKLYIELYMWEHQDGSNRFTTQHIFLCHPTYPKIAFHQSSFLNAALQKRCFHTTPSQPSQAKVLTGGRDLRGAQIDVPLSVRRICLH